MAGFVIAYMLCTLLGVAVLYSGEPTFKTMSFWRLLPLAFGLGAAVLIIIHQILLLVLV